MTVGFLLTGVGAGGGGAAVSTTFNNQGGNASNNTGSGALAITTAINIAKGDLMIIGAYSNTTGNLISTIADPGSNTWNLTANSNGSSGSGSPVHQIYWAIANAAIGSGGTVTVTWGSTTNRQGFQMMSVPGPWPSGTAAIDKVPAAVTGTATSATSIPIGTLTQPNELLFGMMNTAATPGTFTQGGSWSAVGSHQATAFVYINAQAVSSTASVNWAPTWVNSVLYSSIACSFKGV